MSEYHTISSKITVKEKSDYMNTGDGIHIDLDFCDSNESYVINIGNLGKTIEIPLPAWEMVKSAVEEMIKLVKEEDDFIKSVTGAE